MKYALMLALVLFGFNNAKADDYHVIVFSYNNSKGRIKPTQTHTFATWIRSNNKRIVDQVDISWRPVQRNFHAVVESVPGCHKCLSETLNDCNGMTYKYWILRTNLSFFEAAKKQHDSLTLYKMLDGKVRPKAVNCIHACSDVAGYIKTGTTCGIPAGQMIVDFYLKKDKAQKSNDRWVLDALLKANNCKLP